MDITSLTIKSVKITDSKGTTTTDDLSTLDPFWVEVARTMAMETIIPAIKEAL